MAKKNTEVAVAPNVEMMEQLRQSYPVEAGFQREMLPRLGMVSQDKVEGKGKAMKVVAEAGTFFVENQTEELDENGKKVWEKEDIGTSMEGIILYHRKQLKFCDSATETYTSSPVYDSDDEVLPLFLNKAEVDRGTPAELKSRKHYQGLSAAGKPTSKLEENRILYVLYKGQVHQMNLRGSSMFAFLTFAKKVLPPSVLVSFGSEAKEKGSIQWNQMTFTALRPLSSAEVTDVLQRQQEIRDGIAQEKAFFANKNASSTVDKAEADFQRIGSGNKDF